MIFGEIYWSATGGWILLRSLNFFSHFFVFSPLINPLLTFWEFYPDSIHLLVPCTPLIPAIHPPQARKQIKASKQKKKQKKTKTNKQAEKQRKHITKTKQNLQQHKNLFASSSFLLLQNFFILSGAMDAFVCHNFPPINSNICQLKSSTTYIFFFAKNNFLLH